ncbi:MAG: class I SAM-dependent methyltransferase [Ilumatobacter sp.]|uniref:class I SAM-dependent methyltransferase n=1 Tax=Ilumatobacter sp. TaxID=1967498 RepID=UPI003C7663EC
MHSERGADDSLDYDAVRSYWEDAAAEADSASYMAHDQGLPQDCIEHRFTLEGAVIDRWFANLGPSAALLDIGCGAGAWTARFAAQYARVVGVDASAGMLDAARRRLAGHDHVELVEGDALTVPLDGDFDGVLVGGLLMYLDRADAESLLRRLSRLAPNGRIILRESGVRSGVEVKTGEYQVVYRSVDEYRSIARDAGLRVVAVERNRGYAHMEVAITLTELFRRLPPLARRDASATGGPLWRLLRRTEAISLGILPRAIESVGLEWPHLINNFLLLEPGARSNR